MSNKTKVYVKNVYQRDHVHFLTMNKVDLKLERRDNDDANSRNYTFTRYSASTCKNIIPNVKQLLSKRTKHNRWNFEIKVDLMIGSAEDVHESVEKAAQIKEAHQWDYVVCLTDLPSISDNKVVVSDFNSDKHVAMLSLPSLGFIDLKRKLVKTMTSLIEQLYYNQPKTKMRHILLYA